jgi:diguanylate cyclase (GGDEF)-like protein
VKAINKFRLDGYLPPDQEKAYRERFLPDDVRLTAIAALVLGLTLIGFAAADYEWFGLTWGFYGLLILRVFFVIYSAAIVSFLYNNRRPDLYDWNVFAWLIVGTAVVMVVNITRPGNYVGYAMIDVVLVVIVYLAIPLPALLRCSVALLATAAEVCVILAFKQTAIPAESQAALAALALANVIGIFASGRIHSFRRKEFAANRKEEEAREELEKLASTDDLTGIMNRRVFMKRAEEEFTRFKRYGRTFCYLLIDIDRFKQVNDRFDHLTGDVVLKRLAQVVNRCVRRSDVFGRIGGDEFGVVLMETDSAAGMAIAERILADCVEADVTSYAGAKVEFTVSIGLTLARKGDETPDQVFARADEALYTAKQKGRNRLEAA